jgi:hypothetical protein
VQNNTPLNCTQNSGTLDNGEFNHCEWGVVSRDGWVVYDDTQNFILDENDWWVANDAPQPPRSCHPPSTGMYVPSGRPAGGHRPRGRVVAVVCVGGAVWRWGCLLAMGSVLFPRV